jgi:DNA-binding winged helix-turn-helix (wHTH) protein
VKIRFGGFTLDLDTRQVTRASEAIHLSPKAFELLSILASDRPRALSKAELQERLWPGTFVAEANLSNLVAEVRAALGDESRTPRFIRTVHRFGYAFCADAATLPERRDTDGDRSRFWVQWGMHRTPVGEGTSIVGRDPDVEVRLDASTVSRRHARIVITEAGATLEDLGSKNGTFLCEQRVTSPAPLGDGDSIRIGSESMTFHRGPLATETAEQTVPTTRGGIKT